MPCWGGRSNRTKRRNRGSGDSVLEASAGRAAAPKVRLEGLGCFPASTTGGFHASGNRLFSDFGAPKALLARVQCLCQQRTGTAADHIRTGLRKGSACLNMDISRGLKVAQLLAGFPDGITLYVDRPFIPREYQCFSWLGTAPSVYLCNLRACWLLHRDESVPIIERGMEVDTVPVAGIDVSKRFSDLCILSPENQVFSSTRIYHDKTSMDRARDLLLKAQAEFGHAFALMEIIEQLPSVQRSAITLYYIVFAKM